ncbi:MAG: hypothetical protein HYU43_05110 [Armatimonadetes bacterium]|nr:hypothetical protein [Armatimonadota bacterium]
MNPFRFVDTLLRDRERLYSAASGVEGVRGLLPRLLGVFVLTAALYGAAMGSFRCFHPEFFFSDFELVSPEGKSVPYKVAGFNAETRRLYTKQKDLPPLPNASVRFNVAMPSEPYKVAAVSEQHGYTVVELEAAGGFQERDAWRIPLLIAVKVPLLFTVTVVLCAFALYMLNLAFGVGLRFAPSMLVMAVGLAATGVMLGVLAPIALLFSAVTENYHFMKVFHVFAFTVAGLFGVQALYGGLCWFSAQVSTPSSSPRDGSGQADSPGRSTSAPIAKTTGRVRVQAVMLSWLLLYALVGAQIAWTLKPFLGTPYLPATPPFRMTSGNIYVAFFESFSRLAR